MAEDRVHRSQPENDCLRRGGHLGVDHPHARSRRRGGHPYRVPGLCEGDRVRDLERQCDERPGRTQG